MNIQTESYSVTQNTDSVIIQGALRLDSMEEYQTIQDLLIEFATQHNNQICVDVSNLQLLNSSGITMLSKFVIHCRKNAIQVKMQWNSHIAWQGKSLKNLQRLLPSLELACVEN